MTVKQAQILIAQDLLNRHHKQALSPKQCGSTHVQPIGAPISVVWPIVRRFDSPQDYKRFVSTCSLLAGAGGVGSIRQVRIISGLPAATSIERLDDLDDERHIVRFTIIGGDHRLANYQSTLTLHEYDGRTVAIESYVVDVPQGSTEEDTILFTDTIVKCNLRSLARISEKMAQSN